MSDSREPLARIVFDGEIIEWRGPAPYLFIAVPKDLVGELRYASRLASYRWGVIPAEACIGAIEVTTSLFPRGETYLLPVKVAVQKAAGVALGDRVRVEVRIVTR